MKNEENQKRNFLLLKSNQDSRSRSLSPKTYIGCGTCRQKNTDPKKVKSVSKLSDFDIVQDKNKQKKISLEREKNKKDKVKLTDLCVEDKKRIVDLIEELSKFAEKNQQLKESLDRLQKIKQEQQYYILKQTNLYIKEKNFYLCEINKYKNKVEILENDLKSKTTEWESQKKYKNAEINNLAKALAAVLKDKKNMTDQIQHLEICLKESLESYERLRIEVNDIQREEPSTREFRSISCQTETNGNVKEEKFNSGDDSEEDDFLSTNNQEPVKTKSSLDVINDKLEYVYQLLKRKSESLGNHGLQKFDIDLSVFLKNDKFFKENVTEENFQQKDTDVAVKEENEDNTEEKNYMFSKPFDQCSKTSIQAERILKKIGKPLNLIINDYKQTLDFNKLSNISSEKSVVDFDTFKMNILQNNNIVQKNNLFKSSDEYQYDEDRLLDDLFYSDQSLNFGLKSVLNFK